MSETMEIARDVARRLLEAQSERRQTQHLADVGDKETFPLVVGY